MQYVYILTRRDEYAPAQHDDQIIGCYAKEQDLIDMLKEAYPNMEQRGNCIYPNDKWHTNTTYIITERPVLLKEGGQPVVLARGRVYQILT